MSRRSVRLVRRARLRYLLPAAGLLVVLAGGGFAALERYTAPSVLARPVGRSRS